MSPDAGSGPGAPGVAGPGPASRTEPLDRRAIEALRGPKTALDPRRPIRVLRERERLSGGGSAGGAPAGNGTVPVLAIFLAGAECPFRCVFCDLWRETLDGPTPPGAIAEQVRQGLDSAGPQEAPGRPPRPPLGETVVKLYNASNFFDPRAVPVPDLDGVAALLAPARRVVVECHPRLILDARSGRGGDLCRRFARGLADATLEVAMGLETVHPEAFSRLNKGMALDDFGRAADRLRALGVLVRAFVLVGAPFVPPDEAVEWAVRSVEHALAAGASNVALIPVRGGNGALDALAARGAFSPPRLEQLEEALDRSLEVAAGRGRDGAVPVVTADLWDLERFAACPSCLPARRARLERANATGRFGGAGAAVESGPAGGAAGCPACGWDGGRR